jgi:protein LSM14
LSTTNTGSFLLFLTIAFLTRGTGLKDTPDDDFDFQSSLANFQKEDDASSDEEEEEEGGGSSAYAKDDFFDSISCDALDKQNGVNNRLRGSEERSLNTETFGATALDSQRRRRYVGRGGRGCGRGGRGGRGGGGQGPRPQNNRWNKGPPSHSRQRDLTQSGVSS